MPATHVSYEGGSILSVTRMLCVVIKICLAESVAQFEAHLRLCVVLGLGAGPEANLKSVCYGKSSCSRCEIYSQ